MSDTGCRSQEKELEYNQVKQEAQQTFEVKIRHLLNLQNQIKGKKTKTIRAREPEEMRMLKSPVTRYPNQLIARRVTMRISMTRRGGREGERSQSTT